MVAMILMIARATLAFPPPSLLAYYHYYLLYSSAVAVQFHGRSQEIEYKQRLRWTRAIIKRLFFYHLPFFFSFTRIEVHGGYFEPNNVCVLFANVLHIFQFTNVLLNEYEKKHVLFNGFLYVSIFVSFAHSINLTWHGLSRRSFPPHLHFISFISFLSDSANLSLFRPILEKR